MAAAMIVVMTLLQAVHAPKQRSQYFPHHGPRNRLCKYGHPPMLRYGCSEDAEYEVERVLAVRLHFGNLQYPAQWVGYKADLKRYNAPDLKRPTQAA
jgi:hypothetical protein